jgi:HEAT repeat protein
MVWLALAAPEGVAEPAPAAGVDKLVEALAHDPAFKVRLQAAALLRSSSDERATRALLAALERDPHPAVRAQCAANLGERREPRAVAPLLTRIGADPDAFVQGEARRALGGYDRASTLELVLQAYGSPYVSVRRAVLAYVAEAPAPTALPVLTLALGDAPELVELTRKAVAALPPEERWSFYAAATTHREPSVRKGAVDALGDEKAPEAAALVLGVFERDIEEQDVRDAARWALRKLVPYLPVSRITSDASSPEKHARARALRLLGAMGGADARRVLLASVADPDPWVRGIAVLALGELGDVSVIPELEKAAADPANQRLSQILDNTLRELRSKAKGGK